MIYMFETDYGMLSFGGADKLSKMERHLDQLYGDPLTMTYFTLIHGSDIIKYGDGKFMISPNIVRIQDLDLDLGESIYYISSFEKHELKLRRISFG